MKEHLDFYIFDTMTALRDLAAGRVRSSWAHLSTFALWVWVTTSFFVTALPPFALAQLPGPKFPGSTAPSAPTIPTSKAPNITPATKQFVADPFTLSMQPPGSGPFYTPADPNCPAQSFRFESRGGYAPITWSLPQHYQYENQKFLLVDPRDQTGTSPAPATLPLKPASPSTRLLRAPTLAAGVSRFVTVQAVDGSGQKREIQFQIRPTRACGPPVLSGATDGATSSNVSQITYTVQVANFYNGDNWDRFESRVECGYSSGLRVACEDDLQHTGQWLRKRPSSCSSPTACRIKVPNIEGSGTVAVRLRNPYGTSTVLTLNVTFPSAVRTQNETFALPSTIAKEPATVTGMPGFSDYMGEAAPSCPKGDVAQAIYLVWRGLTFSDPSGRAKLERPVKPGARVAPSTLPQWEIAPGSNQVSIEVNYEVERRHAVCEALVIQ